MSYMVNGSESCHPQMYQMPWMLLESMVLHAVSGIINSPYSSVTPNAWNVSW